MAYTPTLYQSHHLDCRMCRGSSAKSGSSLVLPPGPSELPSAEYWQAELADHSEIQTSLSQCQW